VANEMRPISPPIKISHLRDGIGTQMEALALLCERVCTEESKQTKGAVEVLSAVPSVPLQVLLDVVKCRKEHQSDYDGSLQWLASGAVVALLQGQIRSYSGLDPHEHSEENLGTVHEPAIKQAKIVGDELESNSFVKMMALTTPALVSNAAVKSQLHQLCAADDRSLITQLSLALYTVPTEDSQQLARACLRQATSRQLQQLREANFGTGQRLHSWYVEARILCDSLHIVKCDKSFSLLLGHIIILTMLLLNTYRSDFGSQSRLLQHDGIFSKLDGALATGDTSQLTGVLLPALNQAVYGVEKNNSTERSIPASGAFLEVWVLRSFLSFYHRSVKSSCLSRAEEDDRLEQELVALVDSHLDRADKRLQAAGVVPPSLSHSKPYSKKLVKEWSASGNPIVPSSANTSLSEQPGMQDLWTAILAIQQLFNDEVKVDDDGEEEPNISTRNNTLPPKNQLPIHDEACCKACMIQ